MERPTLSPDSRMRSPLQRREWMHLATATSLIGLVLIALYHWQPAAVTALASAVSDTYYPHNHALPSRDIVFIAVDHKAVQQFGRWPWPRRQFAAGIDKCRQARVVALDIVFSEATDPEQDSALGQALSSTTSIGGFLLNGVQSRPPDPLGMNLLANSSLTDYRNPRLVEGLADVELSIPVILAGQSALASLNTLPDQDERFRHYPAAFALFGLVMPSLGVQTLQLFLDSPASLQDDGRGTLRIGPYSAYLDRRGFTRLNLYPEKQFRTLSFADLFAPDFDPASLTGKLVLIGVTEAGVADIRATPLGQYPGPLMHAAFLANMLDGHGLRELPTHTMALIMSLVLMATLSIMLVRRIPLRAALYLSLGALIYGIGVLLYREAGIWLEVAYLIAGVMLTSMQVETALLAHSRKHAEQLRTAFSTYLPPAVVNRIVANPGQLKLGGEKKFITILFSDIRGFTAMSENVTPERLAEVMACYFEPMTEVVFTHGGTLDKYIGDAIMALFNAPLDLPEHTLAACRTAIAMQVAQRAINEKLADMMVPPIRTGIGIHCGEAIVGNLGSSIRFNYTAIGDSVNLASRLESATKTLAVDIVISESVYLQVAGQLPCRALGAIAIAGKDQPQQVYELCWEQV